MFNQYSVQVFVCTAVIESICYKIEREGIWMISVIIPAYNAEKYLDRCMNSVVNQTYREIEIIIINDGSTDGTLNKCLKWQQFDDRIIIINQENQGQGIARNRGISRATGNCIAFIDSDDWWDKEALQKAYSRMKETNADIVVFDVIQVKYDGSNVAYTVTIKNECDIETVTNISEDYSLLYKLDGALWNKLWKADNFSGIKMPGHPFEDEFVVDIMLAKAKRIAQVKEVLYYYRIHKESTVFNIECVNGLELTFTGLRDYFISRENSNCIYDMLRIKVLVIYQNILRNLYDLRSKEEMIQLQKRAIHYFKNEFPARNAMIDKPISLIGSYNIRAIIKRIDSQSNNNLNDFALSSIISMMQKKNGDIRFDIQNIYKKEMLEKDANGTAGKALSDYPGKYEYVVMDFLEETRGLIEFENVYYTFSEELKKKLISEGKEYKRIEFLSQEYEEVWKKHIAILIAQLKETFEPKQIILMCNYLSEYKVCFKDLKYRANESTLEKQDMLMTDDYDLWIARKRISEDLYFGTLQYQREYFADQPKILGMNAQLAKMYDYFIENYTGTHIIRVANEYCGTDRYFKFGVHPEYFNEAYYLQAADQLKCIMNK